MKVLQVNNFHYPRGGSDRYFLDLTGLLESAGHVVGTFSTKSKLNVNSEWLCTDPVSPVETDNFVGIGQISRAIYSREAARLMEEALRVFRPDVVHLHIYYGQLTSSILAPLRKAGVAIVQTLHEYKTVCPTHGLFADGQFCDACQGKYYWRAIVKRCNRKSATRSAFSATESYVSEWLGSRDLVDRFITVSEFQESHLVRLGLDASRIDRVPHFATPRLDGQASGRDEGFLLYVGRLSREKGAMCLIEAMARLGDDAPILHVVGTGAQEPELRQRATELGLGSKVFWKGFLDGKELAQEYRSCAVLVNPSLANETFGLSALEAMSFGKPVIASNAGALPELVRQGLDGMLFPAGDIAALAECLAFITASPEVGRAMGASALRRVRSVYSPSRHVENVLTVYERAQGRNS